MGQLWPQGSRIGQQVIHPVLIASLILDLQLDLGLKEQKGAREGIVSQGNFHQSFSEAKIYSTFVDDCGLPGSRSKDSLWAEP